MIISNMNASAQLGLTLAQRDSINKLTQRDYENMKQQLGILTMRPGPSGNEQAANHANYEESIADPCPILPDILTLNSGDKVKTIQEWNAIRKPELITAFESEVYGRIPKLIPSVKWTVDITDREWVGRIPVIAKKLTGHVDNTSFPSVQVNISMVLVLPTNVTGPVPILIMFGRPQLPAPGQPSAEHYDMINNALKDLLVKSKPELQSIFDQYPAYQPLVRNVPNFFAPLPTAESPGPEQLLAAGWGYCTLDPGSIQEDHGAGLTKGIIGLVNKGQYRKPDDWGALRAWAWGAARALDYLERDAAIDAKKVGIEGVSRYGKAALVTLAFEPRFAVGLIGSSGKGGATLHRRVFGESVENLTGSGEYHWMCGNYLKYGAETSSFGRKTGCNLPVDSHELIALCAPRLCFISYGIPEKGDAKWLDQKGSYKSAIAAGAVYKLLGSKDLGLTNDYNTESMPKMLTSLIDGDLAWRQHDGGHTDQPNYIYFIPWASKKLGYEKKGN